MYAEVAIPLYVNQTFTYLVPERLQETVQVGCRCLAPFGRRLLTGYIVGLSLSPIDALPDESLKKLEAVLDEDPVIIPEILELTRWIADYYYAPWGEVLKASLPTGMNSSTETTLTPTDAGRQRIANLPPERIERSTKWKALKQLLELGQTTTRQLQKEHPPTRASAIIRELEREGLIHIEQHLSQPLTRPRRQNAVRLAANFDPANTKLTEPQQRVVECLGHSTLSHSELLDLASVSAAVIRTMEKKGYVEVFAREVRRDPLSHLPITPPKLLDLTDRQSAALQAICEPLERGEYATFLLHGVTGAGKTEVYLRAMRRALDLGKTAMMLVPEISLAPMFSRRLREQFGEAVAILHSSLSDGERMDEWQRIYRGEAQVVIGARSAVFAPLRNLGLLVVDEEHESTYKQEETPRYNGRDTAIMRALKAQAVVILGSATPSLESYHNANSGKYGYLHLPSRIGGRPLANVEVIDMRAVFKRHGKVQVISEELASAMAEVQERGEQAIVLLNKRGYSSFLLCRSCGNVIKCRDCDVTLTYHREVHRLICHYCNFQRATPQVCPGCNSQYIHYVGEGTEQLEAIFKGIFPEASIARLDRDTTRRRGAYERLIGEFASGEIDILIGTQMVAKGHDFPNVTLVGVVSVDVGLGMPDFRAAERTFQLLTQVAGRAGRGDTPGKVLIQSYHPEHYSLKFAAHQDYQSFYEHEIEFRRAMYYPPFSVLVNIIIRNKELSAAQATAAELARQLRAASQQERSVRVLGPASAPIARIKGEHRMQILVKAKSRVRAREVLDLAIANMNCSAKDLESITIDVDPIDLI